MVGRRKHGSSAHDKTSSGSGPEPRQNPQVARYGHFKDILSAYSFCHSGIQFWGPLVHTASQLLSRVFTMGSEPLNTDWIENKVTLELFQMYVKRVSTKAHTKILFNQAIQSNGKEMTRPEVDQGAGSRVPLATNLIFSVAHKDLRLVSVSKNLSNRPIVRCQKPFEKITKSARDIGRPCHS